MNTTATEPLSPLVEKYAICWSKAPARAVVRGELRSIGWELELCATHGQTAHPPTAGCRECPPVVDALERVARSILPSEHRSSRYEVHVRPGTIQYSHVHPGVAEMVAVITIEHKEGINEPIDACENLCLADMESKLRALGSRERG